MTRAKAAKNVKAFMERWANYMLQSPSTRAVMRRDLLALLKAARKEEWDKAYIALGSIDMDKIMRSERLKARAK